MPPKFRVRFAPTSRALLNVPAVCGRDQHSKGRDTHLQRSRLGCKDCKRRRVKCDETFPVCIRCQKRGTICESEHSLPQWQIELPGLLSRGIACKSPKRLRLLRYWCEKASQIMVSDPELNPFSFPILEYLESSPSLLPTILSISAAHEQFFREDSLGTCLEERSMALSLLRDEIGNGSQSLPATFLSIFMLGISTPWIDTSQCQFGYEHLNGARALIELITNSPSYSDSQFAQLAVGTYLYWDMACSFLIEPDQQFPLGSSSIQTAVQKFSGTFHPIMGYSVELMHLLGTLGRYCRTVIDLGIRDVAVEREFNDWLLAWQPACESFQLTLLGNSFRHHGLINLYRICGRPSDCDVDLDNRCLACNIETAGIIRQCAQQTVQDLDQIPTNNWHTNMQAISLLTAGSELTADDCQERTMVIKRFNALYSINRIPGNLIAVDILREVWEARDKGFIMSWIHIMLLHGWRISLG